MMTAQIHRLPNVDREIAASQPVTEVVDLLTELLDRARAGEIRGFIFVGDLLDGKHVGYRWVGAGVDRVNLNLGIDIEKHLLMRDVLCDDEDGA